MAVDTEHPGDLGRYLPFEIEERDRELVEFAAALGVEDRGAGVEEQLGLEHEAVAYDPDIGPCPENLPQLAEKVGAIARQFLHALGQRYIEPLAQVGDAGLRLLVALFRRVEGLLDRRQLAAQRRDLLIEDFDLGQRPRTDAFLGVESAGERVDPVLRFRDDALYRVRIGAGALGGRLEAVAFALDTGKVRTQPSDLLLHVDFAGLFQRQQVGELGDLRVEANQRRIFARHLLRQEELHHHENREQEDGGEDKRR